MTSFNNSGQYDLEERTAACAENCRAFGRKLPRTISNIEDVKQLVRASGSPAANYIEANESLSKKGLSSQNQNLPQRSKGIEIMAPACMHY